MVHMNIEVTKYGDRTDGEKAGSQILNFFRNNREHFSYEQEILHNELQIWGKWLVKKEEWYP